MTGKSFKIIENDISDGYHTFDELYEHRCLLFINLCLLIPDKCYRRHGFDGWPLLVMETNFGQISYHVPQKFEYLFSHIKEGGPEWDLHTSKDVADRLLKMATATTNEEDAGG